MRGERADGRGAVAAVCEREPASIEAAQRRTRAEWGLVASSLLRAVSEAPDRARALDACQAAASDVRVRGDAFALGNELAALGKRSSYGGKRGTAEGLARCFYESAVVVNPMLPLLALLLMATAIAGALVAFALGEPVIAIVACLLAITLLARSGVLVYRGRHADSSESIVPPARDAFCQLESIRKLPDGTVGGG